MCRQIRVTGVLKPNINYKCIEESDWKIMLELLKSPYPKNGRHQKLKALLEKYDA
jgi:hypothetical protein